MPASTKLASPNLREYGRLGDSIGVTNNLCSEVKYRDQRPVSRCSSTLIDVDVVATAGHCLEDFGCDGTVFIFGVYNLPIDGGVPKAVNASDIYGCRRVLITGSAQGIDMAVVQLDRPVTAPFAPAAIAKDNPAVSDPVSLIGFPTGVPMKVTNNCHVIAIGATNYATTSPCGPCSDEASKQTGH